MKKPSLIIGKKQIILSCLTLMLAVAVYVNYAITKDDVEKSPMNTADIQGTVSYGDIEFVNAKASNDTVKTDKNNKNENNKEESTEQNSDLKEKKDDKKADIPSAQAEGQSAEEYFAQARLERTISRDESVATLQSIMGGGDRTDDEYITDAIAAVETSKLIESESNIESIVKSMGYSDCIVYLDQDSAKVVVQTEGLDSAKAAAIKDVILGEVTIPAENIRLFEVK
ncbi:MAG: SpoIIIAH-like family protein [Ruminococcus sp.]|nr:SpoIIIAH-like family protein [Ruminococcus sp.]